MIRALYQGSARIVFIHAVSLIKAVLLHKQSTSDPKTEDSLTLEDVIDTVKSMKSDDFKDFAIKHDIRVLKCRQD